MLLADRNDAGRQLAKHLVALKQKNSVVLALPRGGVPVGFEIARALGHCSILFWCVRSGHRWRKSWPSERLPMARTPNLSPMPQLVADLDISADYLEAAKSTALQEIERRRCVYLGDRQPVEVVGCTAIVVDDGLATGAIMLAAVQAIRRRNPARIVLAIPVASTSALKQLSRHVDKAVCLRAPANFTAVSAFYRRFPQLEDEEVTALLNRGYRR
jgi:putative phosphoribosyl transferase